MGAHSKKLEYQIHFGRPLGSRWTVSRSGFFMSHPKSCSQKRPVKWR